MSVLIKEDTEEKDAATIRCFASLRNTVQTEEENITILEQLLRADKKHRHCNILLSVSSVWVEPLLAKTPNVGDWRARVPIACIGHTVRKEQFKFKLEVLIKFCVVKINTVYNLKICTFICDDKLNCIQFEQT